MLFGKIGAPEIILILVVVVLLFGAKKLPDMARSLGKSARILKSEAKAMKSEGGQQQEAPPTRRTPTRRARPGRSRRRLVT